MRYNLNNATWHALNCSALIKWPVVSLYSNQYARDMLSNIACFVYALCGGPQLPLSTRGMFGEEHVITYFYYAW